MHPWIGFPDRPLPDVSDPDPDFKVARAFAEPLTETDAKEQGEDEENQ